MGKLTGSEGKANRMAVDVALDPDRMTDAGPDPGRGQPDGAMPRHDDQAAALRRRYPGRCPHTFGRSQADVAAGKVFVAGVSSPLLSSGGEPEIGRPGQVARRPRAALRGIHTGTVTRPKGRGEIVEARSGA
ncbi:hypothetical protein [Paracoccus kondratievae]|uniref:hypothetical protein n=1 Tax=Paracoccus kondratievae TaxID=135740 RepID=UPI00187A4BE6|nr:hypothetical protein [Paracoccus kondratievae]